MKQIFLTVVMVFAVFTLTQCQTPDKKTSQTSANKTSLSQSSEKKAGAFVDMTFTNASGEKMPYLLFIPKEYDKQKKYPLALWLHGGGSRGNDPKRMLDYGDKHGIGFLARNDNQSKYPSFVLAPQCPLNKYWADTDSETPTAQMKLVLEILDKVQADYSIDTTRLYVMGISLGGYGTWDIIARRPDTFAAAVPICGGGNSSKASQMVNTSIWAFHGDKDEAVNVSESRKMIDAIKTAGGKPRYTEYKGVGHNSWENAFAEIDLLPWLFAQKKIGRQ